MARKAADTVGAVGNTLAVVTASTLVTGSSAVLNIRISVGASADAVVGIAVLLETELSFTSLLALTVHTDAVSTRLKMAISKPKLLLGDKTAHDLRAGLATTCVIRLGALRAVCVEAGSAGEARSSISA